MTEAVPSFESLLREALSPVEPPEDLTLRLEGTLQSITELAADEPRAELDERPRTAPSAAGWRGAAARRGKLRAHAGART